MMRNILITSKYTNILFWILPCFFGLYTNLDKMLIFELCSVLLYLKCMRLVFFCSDKSCFEQLESRCKNHLKLLILLFDMNISKFKRKALFIIYQRRSTKIPTDQIYPWWISPENSNLASSPPMNSHPNFLLNTKYNNDRKNNRI